MPKLFPRQLLRLQPLLVFAALLLLAAATASAQARYTASRAGDLQIGGGVAFAQSQYLFEPIKLTGGGAYATFDIKEHFGFEADFKRLNGNNGDGTSETTYELGGRYIVLHKYGFAPYGRAMYGRGVYNYPHDIANLGFNLYTLGAGTDFRLSRSFNLRADYSHQGWFHVPLESPRPNIVMFGVAYHFHDR